MVNIAKNLKQSVFNAFKKVYPFEMVPYELKNIQNNSEYDYCCDLPQIIYQKYKDDMRKYWGLKYQLTPQEIGKELALQIDQSSLQHEPVVDSMGNIQFKLSKQFVQQQIPHLLQQKKHTSDKKQTAIIYPFGDMGQKLFFIKSIDYKQLLGVNTAESLARIFEQNEQNVLRAGCIQNFSTFHGLLIKALQIILKNGKQSLANVEFEMIVQTLMQAGYMTQEQLLQASKNTLTKIDENNDQELQNIFQTLNQNSLQNMMEVYQNFFNDTHDNSLEKEGFVILQQNSIHKKIINFVRNNKAVQNDNGFYLQSQQEKIFILDKNEQLTREGFIYGFVKEIYDTYQIKNIIFCSDIQDDHIYRKTQNICDDSKIIHVGHNQILIDQKYKTHYLHEFIDLITNASVNQIYQLNPVINKLTSDSHKQLRSLGLGWIRYFDHKIPLKESYEIKVRQNIEFIFGDGQKLVDLRLNLTEKRKKMTKNQNKFEIESQEDRLLSVMLLQQVEILEDALENLNLQKVQNYIENLSSMLILLLECGFFDKNNKLILIDASLTTLQKCLYVLGVLN